VNCVLHFRPHALLLFEVQPLICLLTSRWGTTDGVLKDGFRISNTQVTMAAASNTLEIKLDAGKTTADFDTVGLWCERLSANFGQVSRYWRNKIGTVY
jgi:hypothetical protein